MRKYAIRFLAFGIIFLSLSCIKKQLISEGEVFQSLTQITFTKDDDFSPAVSKDGTRLLFVSYRDRNYDIYLKNNILSKAVIKKTSQRAIDRDPCFSPDGKRFCFASNRNGNFDIFIMNVEKGFAKTQITTSPCDEVFPDWSPDGNLITFSQLLGSGRTVFRSYSSSNWYIWIKNIQTGQLIQVCNGLMSKFSSDGKKLFYKKEIGSGWKYYQLWQISIDGENDTQLTSGEDFGIATYTLSPHGNKIIFSTVKSSYVRPGSFQRGNDLWILNLENGNQIQMTTHKGSDNSPSWSINNNIFFTSDRMGKLNIWMFKYKQ